MANNASPETVIQVNTRKTTTPDLVTRLAEEGVESRPHPWLENCLILGGTGSIDRLSSFQQGLFYVQDAAAKLAVDCAGITPGDHLVTDCCAAPGGKSFAAAMAMENQGSITSCDIHQHKIRLLAKGAQRLGIEIITPILQDGRSFNPEWEGKMDAVIADVPCSGLGVIRKKPDIRYKALDGLARLPEIQTDILENLSRYVKPGGVVVYSTCTILRRENEDVVKAFLEVHREFHTESFELPEALGGRCDGMLTLLPSVHGTDGFFISKLRRDP